MSADINRLEHIIEAVDRIQNYTAVEYADYEKSLEKQDAVISNFIKLGEAARKDITGVEDRASRSQLAQRHRHEKRSGS